MKEPLPDQFHTTRWTQVRAAQRGEPTSAAALSGLCETYYRPVEKFILHTATSPGSNRDDEAKELTHAFFSKLLSKGGKGIAAADAERGKFRSYLLGAVKHFLSDEAKYRGAKKRNRETGARLEGWAPVCEMDEAVFDRAWALALLERAIAAVAQSNQENRRYEVLRPWLTGGDAGKQALAAAELGISEAAVKVAIHRLRKQLRTALRAEISETVERPDQIDQEVQYLARVLSS